MRKLIGEDLFKAIRIVRAAGIENELNNAILEAQKEKLSAEQTGIRFIVSAVCGCGNEKAEEKIWEFLADLTETDAKKLRKMEINDLMDLIEQLVKEVGAYEFSTFFKKLSQLMRTTSSK